MSRKHLLPTRDHVHSVSLWIFSLTRTPLYYLCIMTAWLFSTIATTACVLAISVVVGFIKPSHHTIFRGFQMTHLSRQILTCEQLINWILKTLIQWLVNAKEKPYTHFQLADTSFQQVNLGKGARRGRSTPTCFPKETPGQAPAVDQWLVCFFILKFTFVRGVRSASLSFNITAKGIWKSFKCRWLIELVIPCWYTNMHYPGKNVNNKRT